LFNKEDKAVFQLSDWSARPLSDDMYNYAAHDSHFLCYIAYTMQEHYSKDKANWEGELSKLYKEINSKVFEIQYTCKEDTFDPSTYRVQFRKILDGFDPQSETFLLTDYIFKGLYK
jgi:hypothetical protein